MTIQTGLQLSNQAIIEPILFTLLLIELSTLTQTELAPITLNRNGLKPPLGLRYVRLVIL